MIRWMTTLIMTLAYFGCTSNTYETITAPQAQDGGTVSYDLSDLPGQGANKKIGWSASGKLKTGDRTKQVTLQADFPIAGSYTLEFGFNANPLSNVAIKCEAQITWTVEGNFVTRRVSVGDGTTVTGVGQAVRVVLTDTSLQLASQSIPIIPLGTQPNGVEYDVSVQVAPGTRGSNANPPVWLPNTGFLPDGSFVQGSVGISVNGAPARISVPSDVGATSVKVVYNPTTLAVPKAHTDPGLVIFFRQNGSSIALYSLVGETGFVPLIPGTDQISISCLDLTPDAWYQFIAIFGVDG